MSLRWNAGTNATNYQVTRNGALLATVSGTTYLDSQVSPNQAYTYAVIARNSNGAAPPTSLYVQTTTESGDRAYLRTSNGPAMCARTGIESCQTLVCHVLTGTGWTTTNAPAGDWGYASDRSWIANTNGTVSYCRRVGTPGDQLRCDTLNGTNWTSQTSPHLDVGYSDNRTYLPTSNGPAMCARTGIESCQTLVCHVLTGTGWTTTNAPAATGDTPPTGAG
ncbi:hypothetical protein ACFQY7_17465 [Actinomadura luteofluorescens]|uniref:hypothetical protein n=1 Tax=Actinomadura luteofluorescens TaxID=46163 RepID=UPI0036386C62